MIVIIIVITNHQFAEPIIKDSVLKAQVSLVLCCVLLKDPANIETIIVFFANFFEQRNVVFSRKRLNVLCQIENDDSDKFTLHLGKGLCLDRECSKVRLAVASPYSRAARSRPSWASEK